MRVAHRHSDEIHQLHAEIERLKQALRNIAYMDAYTRPGEEPASEVMRKCALDALPKFERCDECPAWYEAVCEGGGCIRASR